MVGGRSDMERIGSVLFPVKAGCATRICGFGRAIERRRLAYLCPSHCNDNCLRFSSTIGKIKYKQVFGCEISRGFRQARLKVARITGNLRKHNSRLPVNSFESTVGNVLDRLIPRRSRNGRFVPAVWYNGKDKDAVALKERSDNCNEEILLFFLQLDLTTRIQRALNLDQYDLAQQLREKLAQVDHEIARQRELKLGSSPSKDEAQDKAIIILRLRNELQRAVEEEDYPGAARLRDRISKLEAESLAATAKALAYQNVEYAFRLGQKVRHTTYGYRGVICGMDPLCCESEAWIKNAAVENLSRGWNQPFYQVLVDMTEEPTLVITYVAEDELAYPKVPDLDHFDHPYISFLFYGMDAAGNFIPIKQLKEKYNQPRHEMPWDDSEDNNSKGNMGNS